MQGSTSRIDGASDTAASAADETEGALERIAESVALTEPAGPAPQTVVLPSGRTAVFDQGSSERLTVYNADGGMELTIRFTEQGPVVSVAARALHLATDGELSVDCERFRLRAREGVAIEAGGDLRQAAGGRQTFEAKGSVELRGRQVEVAAEGAVALDAGKEVFINGEKVCLNC